MVGKICAAPSGGSTSTGLVQYLVGYAVAEKGAAQKEIADALAGVMIEAESRPDRGNGVIWSREAGHGTRPSSILTRNCDFLVSDLQMDADASSNPGVRHSAMHFVWSFRTEESGRITDDQAHQYVGEILNQLGLSNHRSVSVVHRDTIIFERDADGNIARDAAGNPIVADGNLHIHCAVGSVDPHTALAYDRTQLYKRMAHAERTTELQHGLVHDRGLATIQFEGTEKAFVRWATPAELAAWRAERREERLVRQERRSFAGYRERDVAFERYADATVAPRLQSAIDLARKRGENPDWATLHTVAARYGCELQRDEKGRIILRDVGTDEMRLEHEAERKQLREQLQQETKDEDEIDQKVAERRAHHEKAEADERAKKRATGEAVLLEDVLHDDRRDMPAFQTIEQSEVALAEAIEKRPDTVLDAVTAQSSTFSRDDVDRYLCARLSDPDQIQDLSDKVMRHESIRMLSADSAQPLMTTTEILRVEDKLARDAETLAKRESGISHGQIDRAIATYEARRSKITGEIFRLNREQRESLHAIAAGSLVSLEGRPGVGKTTLMGVVQVLGEQTNHDVVGLTLSQAAAERLQAEAGFKSVNTARARIMEENGQPVIPLHGIVVVDEASMIDSRANARILDLARERGSTVVEIYDTRQLQPIDFGASARIIRDVAQANDTHRELNEIQRQKRDWHKDAVAQLADAIPEIDEAKRYALVRSALQNMDEHGAITWVRDRDAAIDAAIQTARTNRAFHPDTIIAASDRDTVRHLCEEDRRRAGLEGEGKKYRTDHGVREFAVGDRLMFLENSLGDDGLGVLNGDRGTVTAISRHEITVQVDHADSRAERSVTLDTRSYKAFDYGTASTHHKTQGASVDCAVPLIDKSASAELVFMAVSRSKYDLHMIVPQTSFKDVDELAQHVTTRLSQKTTSRNYDEILQRTGGPDTLRVISIESQREAAPMRRLYDAEIIEPTRALRDERVNELRQSYRDRIAEIDRESLDMIEALDAKKAALHAFRESTKAAYREIAPPESFGQWLGEKTKAHQRVREIEHAREAQRGQQQGVQRNEQRQERLPQLESQPEMD